MSAVQPRIRTPGGEQRKIQFDGFSGTQLYFGGAAFPRRPSCGLRMRGWQMGIPSRKGRCDYKANTRINGSALYASGNQTPILGFACSLSARRCGCGTWAGRHLGHSQKPTGGGTRASGHLGPPGVLHFYLSRRGEYDLRQAELYFFLDPIRPPNCVSQGKCACHTDLPSRAFSVCRSGSWCGSGDGDWRGD